jgi:hypothetical protein
MITKRKIRLCARNEYGTKKEIRPFSDIILVTAHLEEAAALPINKGIGINM